MKGPGHVGRFPVVTGFQCNATVGAGPDGKRAFILQMQVYGRPNGIDVAIPWSLVRELSKTFARAHKFGKRNPPEEDGTAAPVLYLPR